MSPFFGGVGVMKFFYFHFLPLPMLLSKDWPSKFWGEDANRWYFQLRWAKSVYMSIAACTVLTHLDSASVWLEASGGVLCCHPTLYGTAMQVDVLLTQPHLRQQVPLSNLDLTLHQIYPKIRKLQNNSIYLSIIVLSPVKCIPFQFWYMISCLYYNFYFISMFYFIYFSVNQVHLHFSHNYLQNFNPFD